jgi:perosamine synthetase
VEGPAEELYERAFAEYVGVAHGISFVSGRVGLFAILHGLGIGEGDEVLIQVPTHVVVANAIRYAGARPVYVDCRADSYNLDLEHAERLVTPRTRAIVLQHTYGIPVDLDAAQAFAGRHGLAMIEDCVHSLGATFRGRQTGSFGRAAFFSTEETKVISTTLGGMVVTDDDDLAQRLRDFRRDECHAPRRWLVAQYLVKLVAYHVLTEPLVHRYARAVYKLLGFQPLPRPVSQDELAGERPAGYLERFSNAQASVGLRQLRRLDRNVAHRRRIAGVYRQSLTTVTPGSLPHVAADSNPSWCRYPIRVAHLDVVQDAISEHALPGSWFLSVLEESVSPEVGQYVQGSCPNAEAVIGNVINLPTHCRVTVADARRLAKVVIDSTTRES